MSETYQNMSLVKRTDYIKICTMLHPGNNWESHCSLNDSVDAPEFVREVSETRKSWRRRYNVGVVKGLFEKRAAGLLI